MSEASGESRSAARNNDAAAGLRLLVGAAAFVIVIYGLKASADLLVPMIVAVFLAALCVPPMRKLCKMGMPQWAALVVIMLIAILVLVLITALAGGAIYEFEQSASDYEARLGEELSKITHWLQSIGVDINDDAVAKAIDPQKLLKFIPQVASGLLGLLSNTLLVGLLMIFMLLEVSGFRSKLQRVLGKQDLSEFGVMADRVHDYIAIKSWVSLATGACVTIACWALGVDFALMWGTLAFLFNFVPNIGSIIAAIPACLVAYLQLGTTHALILATAYLAINLVIGNALEPRLLGRRLGLSTLVVFVSLLFWNEVWGSVGMLLSVPLTVIVKIALEHSDNWKWIAVLLGPSEDTPLVQPTQKPAPKTSS